MPDSGDDATDQAPIKPVSSLRLLFEKKASSDTGSGAPPSPVALRPSAGLGQAQNGNQTPTRASLDIPKTSSLWSSSDIAVDANRKGIRGPPVPRPRRPHSRVLQRPLSTTSLSTLPVVTVDAPKSPPKASQATSTRHTVQLSASEPWIYESARSKPTHEHCALATKLNSKPAMEPQTTSADHRPMISRERFNRNIISDIPAKTPSRSVPPPVNRTEKPRIPSKPSTNSSHANLEPPVAAAEDRVSPFSTPPSSDGSLRGDSLESPGVVEAEAQKKGIRNHEGIGGLQSRASHAMPLPQRVDEKAITSKKQRPDARALGFTHAMDALSAAPESPPGLPPRREQSQRSALNQEAEDINKGNPVSAIFLPSDKSKKFQNTSETAPEFLPPPKRLLVPATQNLSNRPNASGQQPFNHATQSVMLPDSGPMSEQEPNSNTYLSSAVEYPDASNTNRRPPYIKKGAQEIDTTHDTRLVDICGRYVATTGHATRVWDVLTGQLVANLSHGEKEIRVTSLAFKPAATADKEGSDLWLGTNYGEIQELNIATQTVVCAKTGAHERREIIKIYRCQSSMWTLDDGGRLCVWQGNDTGLPDLRRSPIPHSVNRGHSFSLIIQENLWFATGKDIRVFRPNSAIHLAFSVLQEPLNQPGVGVVTSGATIGGQLDRVFFGHADGKITIYSTTNYTCLGVVSLSNYKVSCLVGAGSYLWAGYSAGTVSVYDTRTQPWTTKKDWLAHENPVLSILADQSSLWKDGALRVVSLGADNMLRFWDGILETDWLENDMHDHDIEYCSFRELTALLVSWNAGAATPTHLRHDERDARFFQSLLRAHLSTDFLIFGFQELVDLEDKRLTAKTLFKGNRKKDPSDPEHMSSQYRAWRDYLTRCIEDTMPSNEPYQLLHTASMVGLFSCVFIKASHRNRVRSLSAAEIKRGMGGLHGNKGALILRFILDDSSVCLINCHLAAGQTQTVNRNNDITAILEASMLPADSHLSMISDTFIGGGDGCMILDHEICILNGDLNYRIDTMGRDTVVKAIMAKNLPKLLERDQLLVSRRRNPAFRIRAFRECPITFPPTYKYDVGTDNYDTSEKRRAPAWCDRILYRGAGKIKQTDYSRHELRASDHRPVSGRFQMRIKAIDAGKRDIVRKESETRFREAKEGLVMEAKVQYLRDVLGVPPNEAKRLI